MVCWDAVPQAVVTAMALLFPAAGVRAVLGPRGSLRMAWRCPTWSALPHLDRSYRLSRDFSFPLDQLTLIMLLVVTGVGFLIHLYSVGYMAEEEGYWRFFAYLNLFLFFMLTLVLAENFLLMFVGWEGVGLASYLLIGFYYQQRLGGECGQEGLHRQPYRRLRLSAGHVPADRAFRHPELQQRL